MKQEQHNSEHFQETFAHVVHLKMKIEINTACLLFHLPAATCKFNNDSFITALRTDQ